MNTTTTSFLVTRILLNCIAALLAVSLSASVGAVTPAISTGKAHACALNANGEVTCWGWNFSGQLGPNPPSGVSDAVQVSAGTAHTCITTSSGSAKCWGDNNKGQLGDGTTSASTLPRAVSGLNTGVAQTLAGSSHSCALMVDKTVRCWGDNQLGQLGIGSTADSYQAVVVNGLPQPVQALSVSAMATCALLVEGDVWCWGTGVWDGGTTLVPVRIGQAGLDAVKLATDQNRICVVTSNGAGKCTLYGATFSTVPGLEANVLEITRGNLHTCALMLNGSIWCEGYGYYGQLGPNTNGEGEPLTMIPNVPPGVIAVSAGGDYSCLLTVFGGIKCWGNNTYGQLGDTSSEVASSTTAAPVLGLQAGAVEVAATDGFVCARLADGTVACWGANFTGQLGDGTFINRWTAVPTQGLPGPTAKLSIGGRAACAVGTDLVVQCWGDDPNYAIGSNKSRPRIIQNANGSAFPASDVTVGGVHRCAHSGSSIFCWGQGGALGSAITRSDFPVEVTGISGSISSISSGYGTTCAVVNGAAKCWGWNPVGQLGNGTTTDSQTPVQPVGLGVGVLRVTNSDNHTCALVQGSGPMCWGSNGNGELGSGNYVSSTIPVQASLLPSNATEIVAGSGFTCALANGVVSCVGALYGSTVAVTSMLPTDIVSIGGGGTTVCIVRASGVVLCWGDNEWGQLGRNSAGYRPMLTSFVPLLNAWGKMGLTIDNAVPYQGASITLTATVPGPSVGGTVSFQLNGSPFAGCASVPVSQGIAICASTAPVAGNYVVAAIYSGDVNHPLQTAQRPVHVTGGAVSSLQISGPTIAVKGRSAAWTIQVTGAGAAPSGSVEVSGPGFSCSITLVNGQGQCNSQPATSGLAMSITATYAGDTSYRPSLGQFALSVVTALDVNADGVMDANDGILVTRYLFGIRGPALTSGIQTPSSLRSSTEAAAYLGAAPFDFDVDLDGRLSPLTDGLIIVRYLLGLRGQALVERAVGSNAFRPSASAIAAYLRLMAE